MRARGYLYGAVLLAVLASSPARAMYQGIYNFFNQPAMVSKEKPEPKMVEPDLEKKIEESKTSLKSFASHSHVDQYDNLIKKAVDQVNREFSRFSHYQNLEYNLIKSMIIEESGSIEHKNTAFKYDPMQIARDFGLIVNRDGGESGFPRNGHPEFRGIKKTQKINGQWDYSNPKGRITAWLSILGGTRYLAKQTLTFDGQGNSDGRRTLRKALELYNRSDHQESYATNILDRFNEK